MEAKRLCVVGALFVVLGCGQDSDKCTIGKLGDCPQGTVCYSRENAVAGAEGRCVWGEFDEEGKLRITVKSWEVIRDGEVIKPLRFDVAEQDMGASDEDNPEAGWLGIKAAELYLVATGSVAVERDLKVIVQGTTYRCEHVPGRCRMANCEWLCRLPDKWAGSDAVAEVEIQLGEQGFSRKRLYRVTTEPEIRFEALTSAVAGEEVVLCVAREEEGAVPVRTWEIQSAKVQEAPIEWEMYSRDTLKACWRATLPVAGNAGIGEVTLETQIRVTDEAGNVFSAFYRNPEFQIGRILQRCSTNPLGASASVSEPLVFTPDIQTKNRHLLFGYGNRFYFYNESCEGAAIPLNLGPMVGPIVALGSTGRVIGSIPSGGGGPPGCGDSCVVLVNTRTRDSASTDCNGQYLDRDQTAFGWDEEGNPDYQKWSFNRGLTLVHLATEGLTYDSSMEWHLIVSANPHGAHETEERARSMVIPLLVSQRRDAARASCLAAMGNIALMQLTPVQTTVQLAPTLENIGKTYLLSMVGREGEGMEGNWLSDWNPFFYKEFYPFGMGAIDILSRREAFSPTGLAAANGSVWLSGPGLQRWQLQEKVLVNVVQATATSHVAIDSRGRAYVVVGDELRRYGASANNPTPQVQVRLPGPIVGSPLLGQPYPEAEVYVVTTQGVVLAFNEELELLWQEALRIRISRGAQPLLVGNQLWVVGERGEIRVLRVGSDGLNRSAHWPKAFRDNCNTSSRQDISDCF